MIIDYIPLFICSQKEQQQYSTFRYFIIFERGVSCI